MNHVCTPKCVARYGVFGSKVALGLPTVKVRRKSKGRRR